MDHTAKVGKLRGDWTITEYQSFPSPVEFVGQYLYQVQQHQKMKQQIDQLTQSELSLRKLMVQWKSAIKSMKDDELVQIMEENDQLYEMLVQAIPELNDRLEDL